jgi:hypothetical protein
VERIAAEPRIEYADAENALERDQLVSTGVASTSSSQIEPREGKIARADHERHQEIPERIGDRWDQKEPDHHDAVHREQAVVDGGTAAAIALARINTGARIHPSPQPVPFSHQHHVTGLDIDCHYCSSLEVDTNGARC